VRAAVLGSPIGHSLSPVLHRAAYARLGLDWEYAAVECDEAGLPGFLAGLDDAWAGLSLTMPLKTAVLPLLDEVEPTAAVVGAVNTVLPVRGRLVGHNTDVGGLVAALTERGVPAAPAGPVTLLGAGATARSAVAALARLGARVVVAHARRPGAADDLRALGERVGVRVDVRPWAAAAEGLHAPLVVSTVPAGVADPLAAAVPQQPGTLFDVVYHPWPTPLAARWAQRGGTVGSGLDLLVHQAALQVRLMTGTAVGVAELVAVLRPAGEAALRAG
jgi:shikimate dehydrogenase